jgi:hypothetical protein
VKYLASIEDVDKNTKFKKFNYAVQEFNNHLKEARCMRVSYVSDTGKTAGAIYIGINSDRVRWNVQFPKTISVRTGVYISTTILKKERKKRKPPLTQLTDQEMNGLLAELVQEQKTDNGEKTFRW